MSLYVCPECGDLGCGAVTANLHVGPETVTWRAIGSQADYDAKVSPLGDDGAFPDIAFTRASYEAALLSVLATMRPLADDFEYPYQRERRQRRDRLTGSCAGSSRTAGEPAEEAPFAAGECISPRGRWVSP